MTRGQRETDRKARRYFRWSRKAPGPIRRALARSARGHDANRTPRVINRGHPYGGLSERLRQPRQSAICDHFRYHYQAREPIISS
jgi:hypothetical protein